MEVGRGELSNKEECGKKGKWSPTRVRLLENENKKGQGVGL
jgi:hypothetical protein